MRVLIDGRKLGHGGIGVYLDNLIGGLCGDSTLELSVIVSDSKLEATYAWADQVCLIQDCSKPYSLSELFLLPKRVASRQFDLYHAPHYTLPFSLGIPSVVTVHDLIHVNHPQRVYYPWIAAPLIKSALRRATRVITVSAATRCEIENFSQNSQPILDKLRVIGNAVDPFFVDEPEVENYVADKFKVNGPYLLALISLNKPHKGVRDLLVAFDALRSRLRSESGRQGRMAGRFDELKLLLVGQGTQNLAAEINLFNNITNTASIQILGRVTKLDLLHLQRNAAALVVPSLAEGFCLPVVEAKALGTPVVARPVPAVLELLNQGDIVAADFSNSALSNALETLLQNYREPKQRARLDWENPYLMRFTRRLLAAQTRAVYDEALNESSVGS